MYSRLIYETMLYMKLVWEKEGLIECNVNVLAHALNLNNQYLTLL